MNDQPAEILRASSPGAWWLVRADPDLHTSDAPAAWRAATHWAVFVYVDHECGTSAWVQRSLQIDEQGRMSPVEGPADRGIMMILRSEVLVSLSERPLRPAELAPLDLPSVPEWAEGYRRHDLEPLREIRELDMFRAPGFPDDVQVLLLPQTASQQPELLWARTEGLRDDGCLRCELLNQPHQTLGYDYGDEVFVSMAEFGGAVYLVPAEDG